MFKTRFNHKTVVNTHIAYEINLWPFKLSADFMLRNPLLGAVTLTKYTDFHKYKYSGYGIGFDGRGSFSFCDSSGFCKNVTYLLI